MKIIKLHIPDYSFNDDINPYAFSDEQRKSIGPIAIQVEKSLVENFEANRILIRGIQSGHHTKFTKQQLIDKIKTNGNDLFYNKNEETVIHAAQYEKGIITKILEGFHVYKPKCEELPQYPVDIWMVFDKDAYKNVEYIHPRHKVPAKDRWKTTSKTKSLLGIVVLD